MDLFRLWTGIPRRGASITEKPLLGGGGVGFCTIFVQSRLGEFHPIHSAIERRPEYVFEVGAQNVGASVAAGKRDRCTSFHPCLDTQGDRRLQLSILLQSAVP